MLGESGPGSLGLSLCWESAAASLTLGNLQVLEFFQMQPWAFRLPSSQLSPTHPRPPSPRL